MEPALDIILGQPSGSSPPIVDIEKYPDVLLNAIFLRCDGDDLKKIRLVCRRFNQVQSGTFFVEKCQYDGVALPSLEWRRFVNSQSSPFDYKKIYYSNAFSKNILEQLPNNPEQAERVEESLEWISYYSESVFPEEVTDTNVVFKDCMVTSYFVGERSVFVDLERLGIESWILDKIRPRIIVSEWHSPRWDCGCKYTFKCSLLKEAGRIGHHVSQSKIRSKTVNEQYPQWTYTGWTKREIIFEEYPVGIRKIAVTSEGVDTQFWAGNYGSKFANLAVTIEFPEEQKFYSEEEIPDDCTSDTESSDNNGDSSEYIDSDEDSDNE